MIRLHVADMDYGPEQVDELRMELIPLRDTALGQGEMQWAHCRNGPRDMEG